MSKRYVPLEELLTEYTERNATNLFRPVAIGRYGIRARESIYSKELAKDYSKNKLIFQDTLTVGMGSKQIDIGILSVNEIYSVSPAYHTFHIKGVDSNYLRYCLECRNEDMSIRFMVASARQGKTVDLKRWKKYKIPIYDEPIQQEIIEKLNTISKGINILNQILGKLDELARARFVEMFGDPIENPMGWDKSPLGKRCNIITGNTPPRADAENYGTFLEWIKSDNINTPDTYLTVAEEYLSQKGFEKCRYVESGSVLMTCIAGSIGCIGNVAVADRRVAFNQQINAIVPSNDETLYIFWLMQLSKPYIQSMINMALKGILSKGQLSALEFPFPPLPRQTEFANFVRDMDKSKLAAKKCLEKAEYLKDALMQEYFG